MAWARQKKIPIGPGRGSGAGCLVAYALKITDIDPFRFKLLFERFLNPERVSPPDFDIDFCMRRRSEVIGYVREKYGNDCVANIITFGTFGAKMVVRDLARINDVPYTEADRIAKMVPDDIGITLDQALEKSKELLAETKKNPIAAEIMKQGRIIEGMVRNTGTHAAGIIIADRPLTEFIPVTLQEGALTTQYPKDPVEELGLLKVDFLGLRTLTIIADAEDNIRRTPGHEHFEINKIPFEDEKTFALLNKAQTIGVFQLESAGMQSLCRQFNISSIEEIVALIALYRPGPMEWIPDYIKGKKDPAKIHYPHPLLEPICKETYGVMVYQEQVMEAAQVVAGYTLGAADILRRAMGKKKPKEMELQRAIFIEGAQKNHGIPEKKADEIFDILGKFAGYGFNKSHSAAYAILAFQTAYLKAHHPTQFMAAVLSAELSNADKVSHFIEECSQMDIAVQGPHINESRHNFTPSVTWSTSNKKKNKNSIRFGLAAIKGVGDSATAKILEERDAKGPFKTFINFAQRVDLRTINRRVFECLIRAGAFDAFEEDRQHLLNSLDAILSEASSVQKDRERGQGSLFDFLSPNDTGEHLTHTAKVIRTGQTMKLVDKLRYEKELLGFYISGHPMNQYSGFAEAINSFKANDLQNLGDRTPFRLCGVISNLKKRISKKENRAWAMFNLDTHKSHLPINLFPEAFEQFGKNLIEGDTVVVTGVARKRDGETNLNVTEVHTLEKRLGSLIKEITWLIDPKEDCDSFLKKLNQHLLENEGTTATQLAFLIGESEVIYSSTADSLQCSPQAALLQDLSKDPAVKGVRLEIAPIPEPPSRYPKRS